MQFPSSLNGYPVLAARVQDLNHPTQWCKVLVDRGEPWPDRYVVASWAPELGDAWTGGQYLVGASGAWKVFASPYKS